MRPLLVLLLVVVVAWVPLPSQAQLFFSEPQAATVATVYLSEAEFELGCKKAQLFTTGFVFSSGNLLSANQQHQGAAVGNSAPGSLVFSSVVTRLPVDFALLRPDSEGGGGFGAVKTGDTDGLQISPLPGEDSFDVEFSARLYHEGVRYRQLFAVGIRLIGNFHTGHERVTVYDIFGGKLQQATELPAEKGNLFVGVLSSAPIGRIRFEENGADADPVVLSELRVAVGDAHLFDGVPADMRAMFWVCFNLFIVIMLVMDLFCCLGASETVALRDAVLWSGIWVMVALAFAGTVFIYGGRGPAVVWLTAYLLEKFLSIDNLFVFLTIFASFQTPLKFQHKVLTWGILGAVILRAVFIFTGVMLVERFGWLLAGFGLFLIYTGAKSLHEEITSHAAQNELPTHVDRQDAQKPRNSIENNWLLRIMGSVVPVSAEYESEGRFFVRVDPAGIAPKMIQLEQPLFGPESYLRRFLSSCFFIWRPLKACLEFPLNLLVRCCGLKGYYATPLVAVLIVVESTDMVFAVDSIPAVLSITQDPFVAYTSNILAVLGLRALYFALAAAMKTFSYLGFGLALILLFIGCKMLLTFSFDVHVPLELTLFVVVATIAGSVVASVLRPKPNALAVATLPTSAHTTLEL